MTMNEEKKLDEKTLEKVNGGIFGGPDDPLNQYGPAGEYYRALCFPCQRRGKDCPYHDDIQLIYETWGHGSRRVTCYIPS